MSHVPLERSFGTLRATAMVVGTIIGASIFVQPSEVTGQVPTLVGVLAVWLVAGILTLFGALICAELVSIFPRSGGVYVFLRETLSPSMGFLWGWAMFWTVHSGIIAAVAVVCARYVAYFVPLDDVGIRSVAIAVIVLLSAVNYRGVRQASTLQTLFTLGKVIAIVVIIALGLALGPGFEASPRASDAAGSPATWTSFLAAVSAGLFAYGGWHMVTYNAGETIDPRRTLPRALMVGTLLVTLCYVALNATYLYVLPLETVTTSKRIAADAADALGFGGGALLSALVIFSTVGALIGIILSGPRVYYSMARDGLLFRWLGETHARYRTPHRAIVVQAIWSSVLVAIGSYRGLFLSVVYTEWIFFGAMGCGLILARRRKDIERRYSIPGYPWVPITFVACAFGIAASQIAAHATDVLGMVGLLLVLSGLPIYHLWLGRRATSHAQHSKELAP